MRKQSRLILRTKSGMKTIRASRLLRLPSLEPALSRERFRRLQPCSSTFSRIPTYRLQAVGVQFPAARPTRSTSNREEGRLAATTSGTRAGISRADQDGASITHTYLRPVIRLRLARF